MKIKSMFGLILAGALVLLSSCASNKIDPSILESDVFTVNQFSYSALSLYDPIEMKSYDVKDVYTNLPLDQIKESFFNKYGYKLSFDLYDENDYANFAEEIITWDKHDYKYFNNKKPTESKQTVWFSFGVDQVYGYLYWSFNVSLPNGKTLGFRDQATTWSLKHEIVEKDSAAVIAYKTGTNIMFERINGININAYMDDNNSEDGFYVPADQEVSIMYTIIDNGNAFVAGGTWQHQTEKFTFEKGKKYKFSYKIDRSHFLQSDWTVALTLSEVTK